MKIKETNKKDKKGFTMIEILIVVAIIAVLAITIIPMVSNYIQKGKDEYNEKLKNQLLVSGKEYYTNNKVKLPVKNYLGVYKNNKDYSYVTLPEIQSENYVSKDFVDADKRECSKSYVYVRQNDDGKDYEWHACLICSGEDGKTINYSKGDPTCEIVDWGDTKSPTCSEDANFVGERNNNNKVFNPKEVYLKDLADQYNDTKEGKLAGIEIKNKTTNEVFYVKANSNSIKANEGIDLMSKITATFKEKQKKEGEYEIRVYDTAGRKSEKSCANFIIDETEPSCTMDSYYDNSVNKKYLELTTYDDDRRKDDVEGKEIFKTIISKNNYSENVEYIASKGTNINPGKSYTSDVTGEIGEYYGHVMDEAGNIGTCKQKVDMIAGEDPTCLIKDAPDTNWYTPNNLKYSSKTMDVECYVAEADKATIDPNQITLHKTSGTLTKAVVKSDDSKNKVKYTITYKPKKDQYFTDEQVVIGAGFVTDSIGKTNKSTSSNPIKVDSIMPKITFDPQTAKESGGWYKAPFRLNISCSDSQSGVQDKTFKVNGNLSSKNPASITWNSGANPKTWTAECKDVAGNSNKDSQPYKIKENTPAKVCGVKRYKSCRNKACGVSYYKTCRTSACGCQTRNRCKACGCAKYTSWKLSSSSKKCSKCVGSGLGTMPSTGCKSSKSTYKKTTCTSYTQIKCTTGVAGGQYTFKACETQKKYTRSCSTYKRCSSCSCDTYYSCANKACGTVYNSCRTSACGVESYETCYHF